MPNPNFDEYSGEFCFGNMSGNMDRIHTTEICVHFQRDILETWTEFIWRYAYIFSATFFYIFLHCAYLEMRFEVTLR